MLPISELLSHSYIYKNLALSSTPSSVKTSGCELYHLHVGNTNASVVYLKFYNSATAPTVGTTVPVMTYQIPASAVYAEELVDPAWFPAGLWLACVTTAADNGSTGPGSGIIVDALYK